MTASLHFDELISTTGRGVEGVGVGVIVLGAVVATVRVLARVRGPADREDAYRVYRRDLGRALLLGLEFLVAGDIIRTVAASPDLDDIAVLGGVVLIRTFLSLTLELETEGRWPWEHRDRAVPRVDPAAWD